MTRRWKFLHIILVVNIVISGLQAEGIKKVAQTSMKWLSIPVGARAISMGSAYYSMGGNAEDIFWNPASVGFLESPQISFTYLPWFADINQNSLAFAIPLGRYGVFAGSLRLVDFGVQQGTEIAPEEEAGFIYTKPFSPSAYQMGLGFTQRITDRFSYGLHMSYAKEELATVQSAPVIVVGDSIITKSTRMGLFNLDFGVMYYTGFRDLRLGMSLKNFSEERGYGNVGNPIPMDWRFGMAMDILSLFPGGSEIHELTFAWDLSHTRDYSERLHFGMEYVFVDLVALRLGYKTNYDEENISFGAGLMPKLIGSMKLGLDYAFVPFGILGSVQVLSISLSL